MNIVKSKFKIARQIGRNIWGSLKNIKYKQKPGQHKLLKTREKKTIYLIKRMTTRFNKVFIKKLRIKSTTPFANNKKLKKYYINISKSHYDKLKISNNLLSLLERRLDSIIYRLHFAKSFFLARQIISHGYITVNNKVIKKYSYIVSINDSISIIPNKKLIIQQRIINDINNKELRIKVPTYFEVNYNLMSAVLLKDPQTHLIPYPAFKQIHSIISNIN